MTDPKLEDHLTGLEQQIVELVERRERARVQGDNEDVLRIEREIDALQAEMARAAESLADEEG